MSMIIGLFSSDTKFHNAIRRLEETGLAKDQISVLIRHQAVQKLLAGKQVHRVLRAMGCGAFLGFGIFCLIALAVDWYACCNLLGYGMMFWLGGVVTYSLAGAVLGATASWFFEVDRIEKEIDFYVRGVDKKGQLVTVTAGDELATKVMDILREQNAVGIKLL